MNKKAAIGLFSGGLDSRLSAALIQRQDFNVYLLHFVSPYFGYKGEKLTEIRNEMEKKGFNLIVHEFGQDYIEDVIKKPRHGVGSSMNSCIDCHRYMLAIAKQKMEELNAEFVFSGEVLGQRPMSQNKNSLKVVEKESGLEGFLVRPLSAKLLDPTIPEQRGVLDREKLLDISGRGRARQV
ncbi:MAG: tRNA 4-thiouridine(8) synthase ThiI, partial [Pseudomonadota bacterium]